VPFSQALEAVRNYLRLPNPPAVIQAEGQEGRAQPAEWEILIYDPNAKPSFRRLIKVRGQVITYDKGPVQLLADSDPPLLNLSRLNVGSEEAFAIANRRAVNARVAFNHIDYRLEPSSPNLIPIWTLALVDASRDVVGRVQISSLDGRVLFETWNADKIIPAPSNAQAASPGEAEQLPPAEQEQALEKVGRSVDRTLDAVGESISNLFRRD
jgi:hypothetical protein